MRNFKGERALRLTLYLSTLALAAAPASPSAAATVRLFAVGSKLEVRYAYSYQSFRDKMFALVDAAHPRRGELVQTDAGDVASHLPAVDPLAPALALVSFPEDVGLVASLIGSRGAAARRATIQSGGSEAAFASLVFKYQPQIAYYTERFPGQAPIRYLLLAVTDTVYRAFYETYADLARTYHVYVTANANLAAARRITATEQPDLVQLLRDPDEATTRDYAYVAESPEVYNTTFIFDPNGNILLAAPDGGVLRSPADTDGLLRGSLNKAYLTQAEQDTLPLAYGRVQDLDVVNTPVGRLASLISKDAWMIDVNDRYEAKGANLILQPEAFSEWAYVASPWQPDGFKAGGFAQLQRNPSFLYNLAPSMTGNLYEVTFDGQSSLAAKRRKGPAPALRPDNAFIGQNPDSGLLRVAPWVMDDPGVTDAALSLAERRALLANAGMHLLPGATPACPPPPSVGACANGYRESVIAADVELPDAAPAAVPPDLSPRVPTAFGSNVQVNANDGAAHQHASVAAYGGTVYVTWQDTRHGYENVFLAVSNDGGAHFVDRHVSDNLPGSVVELRPALALSPDGQALFVAWQELCSGHDDDCGRIKLARFDAAGTKRGPDVRVDRGGDGVGKWNPTVAVTGSRNPLVAWVDERDSGPGRVAFEHIYFARGRHQGADMRPNVRVDAGAPVPEARSLDNKWAPVIAVRGPRIYVAWTDFRNYNWDIFAAHSRNGRRFSANTRVDDFTGFERIHDHPALAVDERGIVHAVWADRRDIDSDTNIFYTRSINGGRAFQTNRQIDGSEVANPDRDTPSNQWHPRVAVSGTDVLAVWQDNRLGNNDIFFVESRDGGDTFGAPERVDDTGSGSSDQYRPALAVDSADPAGRVLYVAWEDDRNGSYDVFLARRSLR